MAGLCSVCTTPCETRTSARTSERGRRIYTTERVRSTQTFPMVWERVLFMPLMKAASTAIPDAAETKFWTASPAICVKKLMVVSPP